MVILPHWAISTWCWICYKSNFATIQCISEKYFSNIVGDFKSHLSNLAKGHPPVGNQPALVRWVWPSWSTWSPGWLWATRPASRRNGRLPAWWHRKICPHHFEGPPSRKTTWKSCLNKSFYETKSVTFVETSWKSKETWWTNHKKQLWTTWDPGDHEDVTWRDWSLQRSDRFPAPRHITWCGVVRIGWNQSNGGIESNSTEIISWR